MQKFDELEFVHRITMNNMIKTPEGYRGSCPVCNEGNSPWKRRCNILLHKYQWIQISCFNCGLSTNLRNFLEMAYPQLFEEYKQKEKQVFIEELKKGTLNSKIKDVQPVININTKLDYQFHLNKKYFKPAKEFKEAIEFCKRRRILDFIDQFKYDVHPKRVTSNMVIFPFYMEDKDTVYGFQGRHTSEKRFHTFSTNDGFKIYNLFTVDKEKPIIAVESLIDSLNITNCISMLGADLSYNVQQILKDSEVIVAPDNDSTGLKKAIKYSDLGYKVFVWPDTIHTKDFGDLSEQGWSQTRITKMIYENSFKGLELTAKLKFKQMRKRK